MRSGLPNFVKSSRRIIYLTVAASPVVSEQSVEIHGDRPFAATVEFQLLND
jgi:hypothetical protein